MILYSSAGPALVGAFTEDDIDSHPELASEPCFVELKFSMWTGNSATKLRDGFQGKKRGRPEDWAKDRFVEEMVQGLHKEE